MGAVNGKNVVFRVYDEVTSSWRVYACARSCSLTVSTALVETSVTGSGQWASYKPQKHGWTGSVEGVVNLDDDNGLTLYDLRQKQIGMEEIQIQYERTDTDGNIYLDNGKCYISSSADTGSVDTVATFSLELQGTGELFGEII